jgi:hypothetical protein
MQLNKRMREEGQTDKKIVIKRSKINLNLKRKPSKCKATKKPPFNNDANPLPFL